MGTFTRLDDAELAELARAFGLGEVTSHRAIAAGTINSNYAIETASGRFFVRINEGKSEQDVAWEARLVAALAERGVVTPAPLRSIDGRPYAPLAQLHVAGLALPESWRRTSIYDHAHLVGRFDRFSRDGDPALAHAISILREELAEAAHHA